MDSTIFQMIFNEIISYIPHDWEKVVFYAEYGSTTYSMSFYIKSGSKYVKCFDLKSITDEQLCRSFKKIDSYISKEQKKGKWTNMTMVINASGKMKTDFGYSNLTVSAYEQKKEWKEKYLK